MNSMDSVEQEFEVLLEELRNVKPDDRSGRDRYIAITITEVEKAYAVYRQLCKDKS